MVRAPARVDAGDMTENVTGATTESPEQPGPAQGPGPAAPPPPGWNTDNLKDYRQLRRSRFDSKVAGVAGGLGRHLNIDPTILRVLFVVLSFFGGAGIVLYGALWLFVPEDGTESAVISTNDSTRNGLLIAAAVVAGALALGDTWNGFWFPWPLAVVGLVVAAVLLARDNNPSTPTPPYPGGQAPYPGGQAPYAGGHAPYAPPPPYAAPTAPTSPYDVPPPPGGRRTPGGP